MTQHAGCNCAETAALAADLQNRLDAVTHILLAAYEADGLLPPAALGPLAVAYRAEAGRSSLICLPGGAA